MLKLRRADVLIENGLELDAWVDVVVQGREQPQASSAARPAASTPRAASRCSTCRRRASTARWATCIRRATRTTRSTRAWRRSSPQNIARRACARSRPSIARPFERNRQAFLARLDERDGAMDARPWSRFKGAKVVVYHPDWIYFLTPLRARAGGGARGPAGHPASPGARDPAHPPDEGRARSRSSSSSPGTT